jgi:hypothetical protein
LATPGFAAASRASTSTSWCRTSAPNCSRRSCATATAAPRFSPWSGRSTAPAAQKKLLEQLGGYGWGPIQVYFRLSREDLAALRTGHTLAFGATSRPGEPALPPELVRGSIQMSGDQSVKGQEFLQPLPPDVARGVLLTMRDWRLIAYQGLYGIGTAEAAPDAPPPAAVPETRAIVTLRLHQSELGRLTLDGTSGFFARSSINQLPTGPLAVGQSPGPTGTEGGGTDPRLARDPALRRQITVRPEPSCRPVRPLEAADRNAPEPRVASGDVLEALHRDTGLNLVADSYTRLYPPDTVSDGDQVLFDALNRLARTMGLRWDRDRETGWLQFRSLTFYDDRLKEVPNRLLTRWAASRRQHGVLTLDDLIEIAGLPDAQLDAVATAEGVRDCWGLAEWELGRSKTLRLHLRYLAGFTPEQRHEAMSPRGLLFTRMSLAQQQGFLAHSLAMDASPIRSLEELDGATLRVDYTLPGWYEWQPPGPGWLQWVVPSEPGRRAPRTPLRARSRSAALQAAQQIAAPVREGILRAVRELTPAVPEAQLAPQEAQVRPTELELTIVYIPGASHARAIRMVSSRRDFVNGTSG